VRQDANRNRAAILRAAREVLSGFDEPRLSSIAQRAGVGQATLYRHFAHLDALIAAVYESEIDELVESADRLVSELAPIDALSEWFARLASYVRVKRGVMQAVDAAIWDDLSASTMTKLGDALGVLLGAGAAQGQLRPDVDPRDVILLSWCLAHVTAEEWALRVPRLLDVLVKGLAAPQ
jgi:AcrR family transcriptional regulator